MCFMFLISINFYAQDSKLLASCCEGNEAKSTGRCSGTAYCTACSNCSGCKHCSKEGGTCGVCTSYNTPAKTTTQKTTTRKSFTSTNSNSSASYSYGDKLIVISENLNLRDGAGSNYEVVEKLKEDDVLTFLSYSGEWIEVRVVMSGNKGYVNSKYVK